MINNTLTFLPIYDGNSYDGLLKILSDDYLDERTLNLMQSNLCSVRTIVIEYPYVDVDYRSTYYSFYSKKHFGYSRFCVRLHLFDTELKDDGDIVESRSGYLGFIILRPTMITPLGRTCLDPRAIKHTRGSFLCVAPYHVNLAGVDLFVEGFPFISQDTDVTVCAHAVAWTVIRYYSQKYKEYGEFKAYDIVELIQDRSMGRLIPSRGLTMGQISEIFTMAGFYPEIFVREHYKNDADFEKLLYTYIESGIPIAVAMSKKEHVVAIIGHGPVSSAVSIAKENLHRSVEDAINVSNLASSYLINDDNSLPYSKLAINIDQLIESATYRIDDVNGFLVPLAEKMYLNAEDIYRIFFRVKQDLLDFPMSDKKLVLRVLLTESVGYKRFLRNSVILPDILRESQLELPMPKFIWLVEAASPEDYDAGMVNCRWIFDATANVYEKHSYLFLHNNEKIIIHERALSGAIYELPIDLTKDFRVPIYRNNLKEVV